jgi:AraC-like DNA-binding protein
MAGIVTSVLAGGEPMALLTSGPMLTRKPDVTDFRSLMKRLDRMGIALDHHKAFAAYQRSRVVSNGQRRNILRMLRMLAEHLSTTATRWLVCSHGVEHACVSRARQFTQDHLQEIVKLRRVATEADVCPQYFCRRFRASTGMTFTEYVCRCRVEKAKELLAASSARISDIAFDCGFQSIPYFNRTFKRYTGVSPRAWRASGGGNAAIAGNGGGKQKNRSRNRLHRTAARAASGTAMLGDFEI